MDVKEAIHTSACKALRISHSAVVLARLANVSPEAFAKAWFEQEANDIYLSKVAKEFIGEEVSQRQQDDELLNA